MNECEYECERDCLISPLDLTSFLLGAYECTDGRLPLRLTSCCMSLEHNGSVTLPLCSNSVWAAGWISPFEWPVP